MWRPEDWEQPYLLSHGPNEAVAYENGADAVLEALKKRGESIEGLDFMSWEIAADHLFSHYATKGTLAFIPEERKAGN